MLSPLLHVSNAPRGLAACLLLSVAAAGCASSSFVRHGNDAERRQDYDRAVVEYSKAVRQHPDGTCAGRAPDGACVSDAPLRIISAAAGGSPRWASSIRRWWSTRSPPS